MQLQGDTVYGKWVSTQTHGAAQVDLDDDLGSSWATLEGATSTLTAVPPIALPGHRAFYDAGLRPQVWIGTRIEISVFSGTGTLHGEVRSIIQEISDGDTGAATTIAASPSIVGLTATNGGGTVVSWETGGWQDFTYDPTPADDHAFLNVQGRYLVESGNPLPGSENVSDTIVAVRWVSA